MTQPNTAQIGEAIVGLRTETAKLMIALLPEGAPERKLIENARYEGVHCLMDYAQYKQVLGKLERASNKEIYARLEALGLAKEKQVSALRNMGIKITETPEADQEGGYTAIAEYFATGEGVHVWYLYAQKAKTPEEARDAWMQRFFSKDPGAGAFFALGLEIIRGHHKVRMPEANCAPGSEEDAFEYHFNQS